MWYKMPHHLNEKSIRILLLIIQFIQSVKWGFRDLCWFQVSMAYFPHLQTQLLPPIYQLHHRFKKKKDQDREGMFDGIEVGWTAPLSLPGILHRPHWMNSTRKHGWRLWTTYFSSAPEVYTTIGLLPCSVSFVLQFLPPHIFIEILCKLKMTMW